MATMTKKERAAQDERNLKARVKRWMRDNVADYDSATALAEAAAHHADGDDNDDWLDDEQHWVWELAIEFIPECL